MRNYWVRIALGAAAIFIVGMVGLTLVRRGLGTVHGVVHGSGPISIPLAFIPFQLNGDKLGTLERVTLERDAPNRVSSVELEVKLSDSLLARGLEGCRLAANLDSKSPNKPGVSVALAPFPEGSFWCAKGDSADGLVEYGEATFNPGDVTVPLFLPQGLVDELQSLDMGDDSSSAETGPNVDSIVAAAKLTAESAKVAHNSLRNSLRNSLIDSLRAEGRRRADSTEKADR
ncbi:MAG: hypothetical protein H0X07_06380 [Gemmatimonadales bacterium]|nr:hypothetical protein [Gemmatimonadales bacterium]